MDTAAVLELMQETAAEVINPRFRALADGDVETKSHASDFVTVADREAEVMLTERLRAANPDAVVVGEEAIFPAPFVRGATPLFTTPARWQTLLLRSRL